jgi:lipoprotein-anchoring transpeptidase ErfK/SrfK
MSAIVALNCVSIGALACEESSRTSTVKPAAVKPAPDQGALADSEKEGAGESRQEPVLPRVDLSGEAHRLSVADVKPGPRAYATHLRAWIHDKPSPSSQRIGYLRAGSSTPTSKEPVGHSGCKGGWHRVEPRGFICLGTRATLDADDATFRLFEQHPPRTDTLLPYRYGTVRKPGPIYSHLPRLSELNDVEPDFEQRFVEWLSIDGEIGANFRQDVWEWGKAPRDPSAAWKEKLSLGIPALLKLDRVLPSPTLTPRPGTLILDRMETRVGHAFLDTFFSEGRRYGLTTHLEVVPTDRYRPIEGSTFHGVEIGKDVDFPFAFVRRVGSKFSDGTKAEYRDVLPLTGKKKFINERLHYETIEGKYISDRYASELMPAKSMPGWAKKGEKWISISINKQSLVLYEGTKPVYATLVSTGEAGLENHEETTATKRGIFRVHTKHITSTMASDEIGEEFELRDVPYVQYFAKGGFALHGAYWHDRFGTPKSHGCINLSPEDARRIFFWTDPQVPPGWHAALSPLRGTVVFVHP